MAPAVDRFIHIIRENDLSPEDIEKVEYTPHPITLNRMWQDNTLRTEEDYAFHGPYLIACAVYRKKSIEFHDPDVREDPRIREFMKKVTVLPNPSDDFGPAMLQDPRAMIQTVTVWAKGEIFTETSRYPEWSWGPDEFRATDDQLIEKFNDCVTGFLPSEKIKKAVAALFKLDEYEDIKTFMKLLIP